MTDSAAMNDRALVEDSPDREEIDDLEEDGEDEVSERPTNIWCRWNIHSFIRINPTDNEFDELCELLGVSRVSLAQSNVNVLNDRICHRCSVIDANLQRFLASLRKLRKSNAV